MAKIKWHVLATRFAIRGVHYANNATMPQNFKSPSIFDQNVRIWRWTPIASGSNKGEIGNEDSCRIYLSKDSFHNRWRSCNVSCVSIEHQGSTISIRFKQIYIF